MEIYQIKVFLEVARHLSFTEAAEALNLTQPAVSAKIKSLESELETPVFHRLGRKVELTEVGRFLLAEAPQLVQVEHQLLQRIEEIKRGKVGNLKIGCTGAIAEGWLPNIVFRYRQKYPEIQTRCVVFESLEALYRAITDQQVDLGLSDVSIDSDLNTTCVDTIRYSAFVASTHPLAKQSWLSLQDLKQDAWAVLPAGSPSRLIFESRLSELGLSLEAFPRCETVDNISLMRTYITEGNYVGFASEFDFKLDCQSKNIIAIPLQEFALAGNVYLLTSKQTEPSETNLKTQKAIHLNPAQKFIALMQQPKPTNGSAPCMRLRSPTFLPHTSNPRKPETLTLSIGVQNRTIPAIASGLIMQRLGLLEHFLPKDGRYSATQYQIRWPDFATGAPIVEGLHSGTLDIGILGDYPLLLSAIQTDATVQKTRLVSFVSSNPDGSCNAMIVPNESNLESIGDLRGRVLAVPFNSSAHGMVMRSLQAANLLGDVQLTSLEHPKPSKAFQFPTDLADSYAHFAPFHDVACRQGHFRYLCHQDLETLPVFYGVVVRAALADQYPEVVIAYLKALTAAQQWYDSTPAALKLVSQWTRVDPAIVSQTLSTSYQNQPGRFFSETPVRPDWLDLHIQQLYRIPGNERLQAINLNQWVQSEFVEKIHC